MVSQSNFTNNMGIVALIYSHTDYSDVWKPLLKRFRKYFPNEEIYFCTNSTQQELPSNVTPIFYDENRSYTERLSQCIEQIGDKTVLFLHEDMILFDTPEYDLLKKYNSYVESGQAHSIKLIPVGTIIGRPDLDKTLVHTTYSKFSIQPTFIKTSSILNLIKETGHTNIWDFESKMPLKDNDYVSYQGTEDKRGMHHYDSKVFPYTATAIVKGKWNFSEYEKELKEILEECNINEEIRGIV